MGAKFLSVLMFQLDIDEDEDTKQEYVVQNEKYNRQMESSFNCINRLNPDIVVYPEMCYVEGYYNIFKSLSKDRLIIAGSYYEDGVNTTVVFLDRKQSKVIKRYASGAEPMSRITRFLSPDVFIKKYFDEHIFEVKGEKVCVLNCMEYDHMAYYIARNPRLSEDVFAIIAPCSTNNISVFEQETMAIHNHNEYMYSFISNCISTYNGKKYGIGESYIYGPIQKHEKEWLKQEGIASSEHASSIIKLGYDSSYVYGEFAVPRRLSRFGRSDFYETNPQNIQVNKLIY